MQNFKINFSVLKNFILLSICAISFLFCLQTQAKTHAHHSDQMKIPHTVVEIWQAIDEQVNTLDKIIKNNQLKKVHDHALAIRDLVQALQKHSHTLSSKAKSNIKFAVILSGRLHVSGDANKKAQTEKNFKNLKKFLTKLRTHFPEVMEKRK